MQEQVHRHELDAAVADERIGAGLGAADTATDAEQLRNRRACYISVENADGIPEPAHGNRGEGSDQGFPYAALAAHDGNDVFDAAEFMGFRLKILRFLALVAVAAASPAIMVAIRFTHGEIPPENMKR